MHNSLMSYHRVTSLQRFKVTSITVMSPSDFGVIENVEAITQQITPVKLK